MIIILESSKSQQKNLKNRLLVYNFTVPEKEVTRIDKNGEEVTKNVSYIITDSSRFISSSLSNFINNLSEGIHKIKCKHGHKDNNKFILLL